MGMVNIEPRISVNYLKNLRKAGYQVAAREDIRGAGGRRQIRVQVEETQAEELVQAIRKARGPYYTK